MNAPKLSTRDRAYLRSLAHPLEPVVRVGTEGLSPGLVEATQLALDEHELIKVRLGQSFPGDRREGAQELAAATGADLVQLIGRIVVLYRPPRKPAKGESASGTPRAPKITLPRGPAAGATK